ncbi:MAG: oligoendopeptidase F [Erysipelotrichaceae bacterium]|nr:oligoendopeptidase F [Erysipelotrichaceae bacterium]
MTELKERSQMDSAYMWDLSSLFENDEAWEKALGEADGMTASLMSYEGKLNTAENIRAFLDESTDTERKMDNLITYAMLRRSEDTRAQAAQSMYARAFGKYAALMAATSFGEPEILSLDEEKLKAIAEDELLAPYKFTLDNLIAQKPHTLSGPEEKLLASFTEALSAPGEIADNLMDADLTFDSVKDADGKEHELSGSNYILLEESNDRTLRENAFRSYYRTYKGHINTFAASYAGAVKAAAAEASVRHYASSREMSLSQNHIPLSVYDSLIETVHKYMPLMYRYVSLRKRLLGVEDIHYYDVYAPLVKGSDRRYTYEEAKQMVLDAVAPLGEDYVETVRNGMNTGWIDVYPNKGKSGGAFSSGTYDSNPYIMTNFTGTLDSVSTIAHEMGHSMHTFSSKQQPPQYAGYTLFVAEVASTVNENLLADQLLEKTEDPKERLILLNQYLEGFKGTVFRQTMFAEFEKEAHAMYERGEALSPDALSSMYRKLIELYWGPEMVIDEEVQYEWARIPHFYNPFYVYVYATGYCTASALAEGILKNGGDSVRKYREFLGMGGSQYPLDELKHAGVYLTTPQPVETALKKFERLLEDAEETAAKLGY